MKHLILLLPLLLLLSSCGPKGGSSESSRSLYANNLSVEVDNGRMTVSWQKQGKGIMSGYNIYISDKPLVESYPGPNLPPSVTPFNHATFPGDTNPDDGIEYFEAQGLENGRKYYVSVRVVMPDRLLSKPSREIIAVCGSRGEISLSMRYEGDNDGYSFATDTQVRADNALNDIYFFSKDGKDYLNSPTKLDAFLRKTNLAVVPYKGSWSEMKARFKPGDAPASKDRVAVKVGDWVHGVTADGHHLLAEVRELSGSGKSRKVKLFFALSTLTDEVVF